MYASGVVRRFAFLVLCLLLAGSQVGKTRALLEAVEPALTTTTVGFETFPGPDGLLNTSDDVPVDVSGYPASAAWFTTEFASLEGGVGVVFDSGSTATSLAAVVPRSSGATNNILVQARPDAGPGLYSYANIAARFVNAADGVTAAAVNDVSFALVSGIAAPVTNTVRFFDRSGGLLDQQQFDRDGVTVSYSSAAGIARVEVSTTFSVATDNWSFSYQPAPPAHTLSGTVYGGGSPLANTTVEALDDGTTTVAAETIADGAGRYSLALPDGTYDLRVTPPEGSGYGQETVQNVTISGADRTYDVILLSAAGGSISGTVSGRNGQPLPNVNVSAYNAQTGQYLASAQTDSAGHYGFVVGLGTAYISLNPGYPPSPNAPSYWGASKFNIAVAGPTVADVSLPVVEVSGTVKGDNGAILAGASVSANGNGYDSTAQVSYYANGYATSDSAGHYAFLLLKGTASFSAYPPSGTAYTPLSESGVVLSGDTTHDLVLPSAVTLSGTVRGRNGQPLPNVSVSAYSSQTGQYLGSGQTDAAGHYSAAVSPGTVYISLNPGYPPSPNAPSYWGASKYNIAVAGPTTVDVEIPVLRVDGRVTDSNGAPVPNVSVSANGNGYDSAAQLSYYANGYATSDTTGSYSFLLLRGSANFSVYPPSQSGFLPSSLSGIGLSSDLTQRIILQRPDLSPPEIVAGPAVVHLSDTSVSISWTTNEAASSRVEYGIGGLSETILDNAMTTSHTVTLVNLSPLATYVFRVGSTDASSNGPTFSAQDAFTTQAPPGDVTPPTITDGPTVTFVDQTNAIVQWTTNEPAGSAIAYGPTEALGSTVTGASGTFRQTHSITLTGLTPETTYFAQVTSADPDDNATRSSVFSFATLAAPDTTAPVITEGPSVPSKTDTKITVAWTTNEPATSGVSYNDGTQFYVVSDATLTRAHEITISGLGPQTTYNITVSSVDAVGNGPTLGGLIQAVTDATPDTTAPVISNLQVSDITVAGAVLTWTTNERSTSAVAFGIVAGAPDNSLADVTSAVEHRVALTGLVENTVYYLTASATDASGNTATSAQVSFKTLTTFVDGPPSAPGPITAPASPTSASVFSIAWGASTDDVGLAGYDVIRDGSVLASVAADLTSYVESGAAEGTHTYQIRATDTAGHATLSVPLTLIVDRTAPVVGVPADIIADAVGTSARVSYEGASATDNLDAQVAVACLPPSGSDFSLGTTSITCTATDAAGNVGSATFSITVVDRTPPTVAVPADLVLEATGPSGAVATFAASASDAVSGSLDATCSAASGSTFGLGTTMVVCRAIDAAGNTGDASFTITVRDTTAPAIASVTPSQTTLWPPNHQMVPLTLAVRVSDGADPAPSCRIVGLVSNEPVNGTGDGDMAPDWTSGEGLSLALRAERAGNGAGRVYTISVQCTDASGNTSAVSTTAVTVRKSQGGR